MRALSAPAIAVLEGPVAPLVLLLELGYSPTINLCSAAVDIDWDGKTWQRTGSLGSVDAVKDSAGELQGLKFAVSGIPSENLALALNSVRGKACTLYLAVLDPDTHAVLDASLQFAGELDQMPISEGGGSSTIGVTAIHRGQLFRRVKPLKYSDADQQRLYPGDTSMRFLVSQANHKDIWPAASFGRQ